MTQDLVSVQDVQERQWAFETAEDHLGRSVDRSAAITTDNLGRVLLLGVSETLLLDFDGCTVIFTCPDDGPVSEFWYLGERLNRRQT